MRTHSSLTFKSRLNYCETKIGDAASFVRHDEDVLRFDVPVSDARFALGADDGRVQVYQAGCCRQQHVQHLLPKDGFGFIFDDVLTNE